MCNSQRNDPPEHAIILFLLSKLHSPNFLGLSMNYYISSEKCKGFYKDSRHDTNENIILSRQLMHAHSINVKCTYPGTVESDCISSCTDR